MFSISCIQGSCDLPLSIAARQLAESDNISNSFDVTLSKADLIANASTKKHFSVVIDLQIDLWTLVLRMSPFSS